MSDALQAEVDALREENRELREDLRNKTLTATKAVASYQQRALQMEIIRQQNEDLDRLAQDLARSRQLEQERARVIEQAARLKSEFLANFSHEIRTPLNGIIGYCDLLQREEGDRLTPHGRRDLGTIKSNAKTLLALINDILDLSKIESGHIDVVKERVDVQELADECIATIREALKGKDVVTRVTVAPGARHAFTDPLKLRQMLLNLLSNAAKFTEMGEIVVSVSNRRGSLVAVVEDTGIGIAPDQLPDVFEKFRQVDGSRTRRAGGTGLGLAIVRELARVLGGDVSVVSTLGRGSTFTLELPNAVDGSEEGDDEAPRVSPTEEKRQSSVPAAAAGARVLVIDDDPLIQQLLRGQLEAEGFEVTIAADGLDGLRRVREERPVVIILDVRLPKLDGWSVLGELKTDAELQQIPVVMLSVEEERARGFSLGAFEYLVKPVEPDRIVQVISRAILPSSGDVLVVDDDAATRDVVARRLRLEGFSVIEAPNGDEALLRVRVAPPALMILDLMMPRLDGFDVLARLRLDGRDFPVVVLTGKDLSEEEQRILREGLARVIQKGGLGIEKVVEQARRLVKRRRTVQSSRLPRILYVEDVSQNRDIVRRYLSGLFDLIEAEDGEAGVAIATRHAPDLILMDLSLPRLDGWEATRRIQANPSLARIPIVALTAHATRQDMDRANEAGCVGYLTKPVDREELIGTIRRHLEGSA